MSKYFENLNDDSFINGEWKAHETFNLRNLFALIRFEILSKAFSIPDRTTWKELLSFAITRSSISSTSKSNWSLSKLINAAIDPFAAFAIKPDLTFISCTQSSKDKTSAQYKAEISPKLCPAI